METSGEVSLAEQSVGGKWAMTQRFVIYSQEKKTRGFWDFVWDSIVIFRKERLREDA